MTSNHRSLLCSSWNRLRSLTPLPSSLPSALPTRDELVDLGVQMPFEVSNKEVSSRWSAFLFAKLINKAQDKDQVVKDLFKKMAAPPLQSEKFLSAIENYCDRTFKTGWDKHYVSNVRSHVLTSGSTLERHKAHEWSLGQDQFISLCTGESPLPPESFIDVRRLVPIMDSGKLRLPTTASRWQHLLAPLHTTLYSLLTGLGTVIRGEPRPHFKGMTTRPGEVFTSGDYADSTNNLSSYHSRHILKMARKTSTHIPDSIWELAISSLTGTLVYKDIKSAQETGQLMGNYLSFPLLCISNICTLIVADRKTAWQLMKKGRVRVNGDDIVFLSKPWFAKKWREDLPESGFVINDKKTQVHHNLFTLNSQVFRASPKKVKKIWHFIPKGLFNKTDARDTDDYMAKHAAIVRENLKGCPKNERARLSRALCGIKMGAYKCTRIKTLVAISSQEYESFPKKWKDVERIKAFESRFHPLKTRKSGIRIYQKPKEKANKEEIENSRFVAAKARFDKPSRGEILYTNDRHLTKEEHHRCIDWLFMAEPSYERRKERQVVWVEKPYVVLEAPTFVLQLRGLEERGKEWMAAMPHLDYDLFGLVTAHVARGGQAL
jgi:hypothetical protein